MTDQPPYSSPPTPLPGDPVCVNVWFQAETRDARRDLAQRCRAAAGDWESSSSQQGGPPYTMSLQFRCSRDQTAVELLDRILLACPEVKGEVLK